MSNERPSMSLDVMIAFEFGLALIALAIGYLIRFDPLQSVPRGMENWAVNLKHTAIGAALALPLLAFFLALDRYAGRLMKSIRSSLMESLAPTMATAGVAGRALVALGAGVGEEILFRGLLQDGLSQIWGVIPGLIVASVVFGLVHWVNPAYLFFATAVGMLFGVVFLLTGSLVAPIVMHAVYDYLALERLVADYQAETRSPST